MKVKRKRMNEVPVKKLKKRKPIDVPEPSEDSDDLGDIDMEDEEGEVDDDRPEDIKEHKAQLAALAEKDPEFYKFLQEQEADLLQFDESDIDSVEEDAEASDKSDFEEDEESKGEVEVGIKKRKVKSHFDKDGRRIVDRALADSLEETFGSDVQPSPAEIRLAVNAFMACVARVGANIDPPDFVVNDEQVFEDVVRMCFQHLGKALYVLLGPVTTKKGQKEIKKELNEELAESGVLTLPDESVSETGNAAVYFRKWKKYQPLVKRYLHSVLMFLNELQTPEVVVATLRSVTQLVDLFIHFSKLSKNLVKAVVRIWSRRTDECRCAAFLVLCKVIRLNKKMFTSVLKACYIAYVSNARLVTLETWPLITFMQKSFAEICVMHADIAYHYAFVYIRQTAIHLRNAMIAKRKDLLQTIYNWQFMMCLFLWARVIIRAYRVKNKDDGVNGIIELGYPLCQVTTTTMKLFPSLKYFPLRLQCIRVLLMVQVNCKIFVPTLSLSVELLEEAALLIKKKPTKGKGTVKGTDINCLLKASTSQLEEAGFRQSALEALFKLQLEAAYILRTHCAFPDIIVPLDGQIKSFVKQCRNADHARLFKSLSTKLNEHAKYIANFVAASDVDLSNDYSLAVLKASLKADNTPLHRFYKSWQEIWKMRENAVAQATAASSNKTDTKAVAKKENRANVLQKPSVVNTRTTTSKTENEEPVEGKPKLVKKKREGGKKKFKASEVSAGPNVEAEDELRDLVMSDLEED